MRKKKEEKQQGQTHQGKHVMIDEVSIYVHGWHSLSGECIGRQSFILPHSLWIKDGLPRGGSSVQGLAGIGGLTFEPSVLCMYSAV